MEGNTDELFKESYKGKIKDKYHFSKKIASGGFGIVYLAEERTTLKKYAIKAI
jgi:serine/threonine protein kinase